MARARRTDGNQSEIVEALRKAGYRVKVMSGAGDGFPDLLTSSHGAFILLECKMPREGLTVKERMFRDMFAGCPVYTVYSAEDALTVMRMKEE